MEKSFWRQHRHWLVSLALLLGTTLSALAQVRFTNVAQLVSATIPAGMSGQQAIVSGRLTASDGGGGIFVYDSASAASTNLGTIFKPAASNGRWLRQYSGVLNVKWFGATGNGTSNDATSITNAVSLADSNNDELYFPSGTYSTSETIDLFTGATVYGNNTRDTVISPRSSGMAAFRASGDVRQWSVSDLRISFADATGSVASSNTNDIGVILIQGASYPYQFTIRDVTIEYAYRAFQDSTQAWDYQLVNVFSQYIGDTAYWLRRTAKGTTIRFENVGVSNFENYGFYLYNCDSTSLNNCWSDSGKTALYSFFSNISVDGFFYENNTAGDIDASGRPVIQIDGGTAYMMALKSFGTAGANNGGRSAEILVENTSKVTLNNCESSSPTYTGAGTSYTLLVGNIVDPTSLLINGCTFPAPVGAGGTAVAISATKNFHQISGMTLTSPNVTVNTNLIVQPLAGIMYANGNTPIVASVGSSGTHSKFSATVPWLVDSLVSDVNGTTIKVPNNVNFGGNTASFFAIRGGGTAANFRLADDSNWADINTANVTIQNAGAGLKIKEGSNARMGTATLDGGSPGTVTVANTSVTANTRIFLTGNADGGTPGWVRVSARVAATSFTITSSANGDTSTVAWLLVEPSP